MLFYYIATMQYEHLFFDLDHTLWDFETNSKLTLEDLFEKHQLNSKLTNDFELFYKTYSIHNKKLWDRYHHGFIKQEELKWKRMWHTMLDFKCGDEKLARLLSAEYLEILPTKKTLFPYTNEILNYLRNKKYKLHLITNGFELTQRSKIKLSNIDNYFTELITSEVAMSLKPKKEIFEFALQKTGATLLNSIMIGDNLDADIKGANNAGMHSVFVNHIEEKVTEPCTFIIHHLKELENIL